MRKKELKATTKEQSAKIISLESEQEKWRQGIIENQKLHSEKAGLIHKVDELNSQVREQTEADLFFTSVRICFELLGGKTREQIKSAGLVEHQARMQGILAQQQMAEPPAGYPYPSAIGGLSTVLGGGFFR